MNNSNEKTKFVWKLLAVLGLVKPVKENKKVEEISEKKSLDKKSGFFGKLFIGMGILKPISNLESQRYIRSEITNQNHKMGFWGKLLTILGFVKPLDDERK